MRVLVITLMMSFLSNSAFGAAAEAGGAGGASASLAVETVEEGGNIYLTDSELDSLTRKLPMINKRHKFGTDGTDVFNYLLRDLASGGPRSYYFPMLNDDEEKLEGKIHPTRLDVVKSLIRLGAHPDWKEGSETDYFDWRNTPREEAVSHEQHDILEYFNNNFPLAVPSAEEAAGTVAGAAAAAAPPAAPAAPPATVGSAVADDDGASSSSDDDE